MNEFSSCDSSSQVGLNYETIMMGGTNVMMGRTNVPVYGWQAVGMPILLYVWAQYLQVFKVCYRTQ